VEDFWMAESSTRDAADDPPKSGDAGRRENTAGGFILALLIGFAGIVFITFFAHFYEISIFAGGTAPQVILNALSPLVFFLLLLVAAVLNPLIHRIQPRFTLSSRDLMMVLALWLVTGVICFSNMGAQALVAAGNAFGPSLDQQPTVKRTGMRSYFNPALFLPADASKDFYYGKSPDGKTTIAAFSRAPRIKANDIRESAELAKSLTGATSGVSMWLRGRLSPDAAKWLADFTKECKETSTAISVDLNKLVSGAILFEGKEFGKVIFPESIRKIRDKKPKGEELAALNRLMLDDAFTGEVAKPEKGRLASYEPTDILDAVSFGRKVEGSADPRVAYVREQLSADTRKKIAQLLQDAKRTRSVLAEQLDKEVVGPCLLDEDTFRQAKVGDLSRKLISRLLIEAYYPKNLDKSPVPAAWDFREGDIKLPDEFAVRLRNSADPLTQYLRETFPAKTLAATDQYVDLTKELGITPQRLQDIGEYEYAGSALKKPLVDALNSSLQGQSLYDESRFAGVQLRDATKSLLAKNPKGNDLQRLNRMLLEDSLPKEIARVSATGAPQLKQEDVKDLLALSTRLQEGKEPLMAYLRGKLGRDTSGLLQQYLARWNALNVAEDRKSQLADYIKVRGALSQNLVAGLNAALAGPVVYTKERFASVKLSDDAKMLINRTLLEEAYPQDIGKLPVSVPWGYWWRPLVFWVGFMATVIVFSASLVRVVHRQWSRHELLTYPLADFSDFLLRRTAKRAFPEIFYDRVFWMGFIIVAVIYMIRGLKLYFPLMIDVPMDFYRIEIVQQFDFLAKYCGGEAYSFFRGWIYPFIVCIAVMLPTEVSISCWLGWVLMVLSTGFYFWLTGEVVTPAETRYIQYGMYFAMAAAILVIGRREYYNILWTAITFRKTDDDGLRRAVRAARVFVLASAALMGLFIVAGMDWVIAATLVASFGLIVLLAARMTAEMGDPWLVNLNNMANAIPLRMLGAAALGPKDLSLVVAVGRVPDADMTNSFAAQETTYDKLREKYTGFLGRGGFNLILAAGICAAIVSTVFFTLWDDHSFGSRREHYGNVVNSFQAAAGNAATDINRLQSEGRADQLNKLSGVAKLGQAKLEMKAVRFLLYGAVTVAICALMRLRFSWWPFHPLPLLFINTWAMSRLFFPIFLGWVIKTALLKIWGGKTFARSKPFFYGVIAGQIAMFGVWITVGVIYYLVMDARPPAVTFFH
jgi:hypothetical protein